MGTNFSRGAETLRDEQFCTTQINYPLCSVSVVKTRPVVRADVTESALRDEIETNRRAAERRERELAELKKQAGGLT